MIKRYLLFAALLFVFVCNIAFRIFPLFLDKTSSNPGYYQDSSGNAYMLEIDPYGWARYVSLIVEHGFPGDELRSGKPYDILSAYPYGVTVRDNLYFYYFSAYFLLD